MIGIFSVWFGLIFFMMKLIEVRDRKVIAGEVKQEDDDFDLV